MGKQDTTENSNVVEKEQMMKQIREALKYFQENGDPNFMHFFDDNEWRIKNGRSPLSKEDDVR